MGTELLEIEFDFVNHRLVARTSRGEERSLPLAPQAVADFYRATLDLLRDLGVSVAIDEVPNEVPEPIRFSQDRTHGTYDAAAAHRFWRVLIQADRILKLFRSGFIGKATPAHFFWSVSTGGHAFPRGGGPAHPGGMPGRPDAVTRQAIRHEVSSAGYWPGSETFPQAAFYSYAYPEPEGFRDPQVTPGASFDASWGIFVLPYEAVRTAEQPDALLLDFLSTTYSAAADAAGWDRKALECAIGVPRQVRRL